jgi:hypothetical protein
MRKIQFSELNEGLEVTIVDGTNHTSQFIEGGKLSDVRIELKADSFFRKMQELYVIFQGKMKNQWMFMVRRQRAL